MAIYSHVLSDVADHEYYQIELFHNAFIIYYLLTHKKNVRLKGQLLDKQT